MRRTQLALPLLALATLLPASAALHRQGLTGLTARRRHHERAARQPHAAGKRILYRTVDCDDDDDDDITNNATLCADGQWQCSGSNLQVCNHGAWVSMQDCSSTGLVCSASDSIVGCVWSWQAPSAGQASAPVYASDATSFIPPTATPSSAVSGPSSAATSSSASAPAQTTTDAASSFAAGDLAAVPTQSSASASPTVSQGYDDSAALYSSALASASAAASDSPSASASASASWVASASAAASDWASASASASDWASASAAASDWPSASASAAASSIGGGLFAGPNPDSASSATSTTTHHGHHSSTTAPASASASASDDGPASASASPTASVIAPGHTAPPSRPPSSGQWSAPHHVIYADDWLSAMPPASSMGQFNRFIFAFWMSGGVGAVDDAQAWEQWSAEYRQSVINEYHAAGIALMVSAFGSTDAPTSNGDDPAQTAQALAAWVIQYGLDGVDIDYEDMNAFNNQQGEAWLITFQQTLRSLLPEGQYLISHAPVAPWFTSAPDYAKGGYKTIHQQVGSGIDWYNVQFYNQGGDQYVSCETLINQSGQEWPGTSVFELNSLVNIPLSKIVIGKPNNPAAADNGYMGGSALGQCVAQAQQQGWNGGVMFWEWDESVTQLLAAALS